MQFGIILCFINDDIWKTHHKRFSYALMPLQYITCYP